jgi:MFS family permease
MLDWFHRRIGNIYFGWWMVAIGSAVRIVAGGLHYYGSSIFFLPVSQELGLSRAATSLVFSLARAQGALEGPLAGYIIDRHGPRPVILAAMFFTGIGYMALSEVHSFTALLLVYMGLISLSYQAGVMDATMAIPANWFVRNRSMAMAWMSASIGLGGLLVTPILAYVVHTWGWRYGALGAGIAFLVIGIPVALPLVRSPESIGLSPHRDPEPVGSPASAHQRHEIEFSVAQALRTWQFWVLMTATTLRVFCTSTITVHFVPIMTWKGLSEAHAAVLLSAAAFLALPAHMVVGWLAESLQPLSRHGERDDPFHARGGDSHLWPRRMASLVLSRVVCRDGSGLSRHLVRRRRLFRPAKFRQDPGRDELYLHLGRRARSCSGRFSLRPDAELQRHTMDVRDRPGDHLRGIRYPNEAAPFQG